MKRTSLASLFSSLALLVTAAGAGCVRDNPVEDITRCPCAPGWTCDSSGGRCIPDGVGGGAGAGVAPGTGGGSGGGAGGMNPTGVAGGPAVAVCGNGVREGGEACDDGNKRNLDGCTDTCDREDGFVCGGSGASASCNRSCAGLTGKECAGGDCCESLLVPGGTIVYDDHSVPVPSFRLDRLEWDSRPVPPTARESASATATTLPRHLCA